MKLYLIAGEDSGDLHGSNLVKSLNALEPSMKFRGVGGDQLIAAGMEAIAHVKDINFMGFVEVIKNLGTIRKLFKQVKQDIQTWQPDAVVLIDYPGFNLRMAKFIRSLGIKVFYYISPQLWAWKKGRVKTIRKEVDRMFVILPFEKEFYSKENVDVDFVGHPLLDVIAQEDTKGKHPLTIALLPGSRKQEISRMLPVMLKMVERFPDFEFVVAGAPSQSQEFYQQFIEKYPIKICMGKTYDVLRQSDYALVTSGTATLETALFKVPQVVCYKGSPISYFIGKRLVQVKYISLVNLILDKAAITELIQFDFTPDKLEAELRALMQAERANKVQADYVELWQKLGKEGASRRTAQLILDEMFGKVKV